MHFYVIMPVDSDQQFTKKKGIIQAEAQGVKLEPFFPLDRKYKEQFDLNSAIGDLRNSSFVIADLSLERPSCYFELGLAQAIGKPTILIAEEGTPIHQAYRRNQVRFYKDLDDYRRIILDILRSAASQGI